MARNNPNDAFIHQSGLSYDLERTDRIASLEIQLNVNNNAVRMPEDVDSGETFFGIVNNEKLKKRWRDGIDVNPFLDECDQDSFSVILADLKHKRMIKALASNHFDESMSPPTQLPTPNQSPVSQQTISPSPSTSRSTPDSQRSPYSLANSPHRSLTPTRQYYNRISDTGLCLDGSFNADEVRLLQTMRQKYQYDSTSTIWEGRPFDLWNVAVRESSGIIFSKTAKQLRNHASKLEAADNAKALSLRAAAAIHSQIDLPVEPLKIAKRKGPVPGTKQRCPTCNWYRTDANIPIPHKKKGCPLADRPNEWFKDDKEDAEFVTMTDSKRRKILADLAKSERSAANER